MPTDYYQILEVARTASPDEIKRAYRKLARKKHPDLRPEEDQAIATAQMKLLNQAYEVLSDQDRRIKYDIRLKKNVSSPGLQTDEIASYWRDMDVHGSPKPGPVQNGKNSGIDAETFVTIVAFAVGYGASIIFLMKDVTGIINWLIALVLSLIVSVIPALIFVAIGITGVKKAKAIIEYLRDLV